jgi:hypothetical protein
MKPANFFLFLGLLILSVLHLAPGEKGCLDCGRLVSLRWKQSISYSFNVRAGEHYRLKLVVKAGDVVMDETHLSKTGALKCVDAGTSAVCDYYPWKSGKPHLTIVGDSKQSTHVLWFEEL